MSQTLVFMSNAVEVIESPVAYPGAVTPDLEALQKSVVHEVFEKSRVKAEIRQALRDVFAYDPRISRSEVVNNLALNRDWKPKDDWKIRQDIRDELWWSPFVDADSISVSVSDGVATLTGEVDTLRDRRASTKNAYEGGARQVRNHLKVRNGPTELRP